MTLKDYLVEEIRDKEIGDKEIRDEKIRNNPKFKKQQEYKKEAEKAEILKQLRNLGIVIIEGKAYIPEKYFGLSINFARVEKLLRYLRERF